MTFPAGEKLQLKVDDVVWREVGDELVVLELTTSTYLTLNGTAKHLWLGLVDGTTFAALVDVLVSKYQIPEDRATADAEAFVAALDDRALLARAN